MNIVAICAILLALIACVANLRLYTNVDGVWNLVKARLMFLLLLWDIFVATVGINFTT